MDQELFSNGWSGEDELKLLHSLERNGYGNWMDISKDLGKPPEECYWHYHRYYFNWKDIEVPDFSKSPLSYDDYVCDFGSMDFPGNEVQHFNPLRKDFEIEPDNEAEKLLKISDCAIDIESECYWGPDDDEDCTVIKQLMLAMVDSYLRRLERRMNIKRIVEDHELLDIYRILSIERALSASKQQVKKTLRPFVRFISQDSLVELEQSFEKEFKLAKRIKVFQEYRSMGISKLKAAELYETLKESRQNMKKQKMKAIQRILKKEEPFHRKSKVVSSYEFFDNSTTTKKPLLTTPLDISVCSGADLLQSEEKHFCSSNRILPDIFLRCKKQMTLEYKKNGSLRLMEARRICRIDVNKTRKIYNFLIEKQIIRGFK